MDEKATTSKDATLVSKNRCQLLLRSHLKHVLHVSPFVFGVVVVVDGDSVHVVVFGVVVDVVAVNVKVVAVVVVVGGGGGDGDSG